VAQGYCAAWGIGRSEPGTGVNDAPITIEERDSIHPGEEAVVRLHPLHPGCWAEVSVGTTLAMQEGSRLVGLAEVIEFIGPAL